MRKRQKQIIIRMSEKEHADYTKRLSRTSLTGNSFGLKCLLCHPIFVIDGMPVLLRELKAIGNNLNQIAKATNSKQQVPDILLKDVEKGMSELWLLLKSLKVENR